MSGGGTGAEGGVTAADAAATRLGFGRFVLDFRRGCLLVDGAEIALRPKTFAVLGYLTANPGRLASKEEIFAAVWPGLAITDDVLVQSIGELRRALGEDAALIRTVPRRGYRFEATVVPLPLEERSAAAAESAGDVPPESGRAEPALPTEARRLQPPWVQRVSGLPKTGLAGLVAAIVVVAGLGAWLSASLQNEPVAATQPAAAAKPVIAVLPLANQSATAGREYFADGLTQDIINALGGFSALTVKSWNAVLPYRGAAAGEMDDARGKLGATYLVEGSVNQSEDRVRVAARLVDPARGEVLWSARYDEAMADLFALQDTITSQIARTLASRVAQIEQRRVLAKAPENMAAYDYVLRARPALLRPTRAGIAEARTLLKRAMELDPNYAAAYAGLAETYYTATSMGWAESPAEFLDRAEQLALEALSLDSAEVRARVVLARILILHQNYNEARAEAERAIAVNPNDAQGLAGRGNVLVWLGRAGEAIEALEQAQRIDPDLNPLDRFALSLAYYLDGRYDAAVEQGELNFRDSRSAIFSLVVLAAAYAKQNRPEDAARIAELIRHADPTFAAADFGTKFLRAADAEKLREGLRLAGLTVKVPAPGEPPRAAE